MELVDFLKIIYQHTFGPSHFNREINRIKMLDYLEQEYREFTYFSHTPIIEDIGNSYYRISLEVINQGDLTSHELNELFVKSMEKHQELSDILKQAFLKKIDELILMIENHKINFDINTTLTAIQEYVKTGLKPMHHSEIYRKTYFPAYRVIHSDFISKNLMKKYIDKAN